MGSAMAAWLGHRCLIMPSLPASAIHCLLMSSLPASGIAALQCHLLTSCAVHCLLVPCIAWQPGGGGDRQMTGTCTILT